MKVGIVGLGSIGQRHATNAAKLGHNVHVYDPAVKGDFRFKYERDLYDWCDAAVIATPSMHHIAGIRACAERGRHILVEKPIATSDQALREMLDFAASKNLVVMIGNNLRLHPCVRSAKTRIDEGQLGKLLWASFTCAALSTKPLYLSDGVILNTGAHEVDLALHLLGPAKVLSASAHEAFGGDYTGRDDIADFVLQHDSGCRSTFHLDYVTRTEIREFRVIGNEGDLHVDLPARTLKVRLADPKLPDVTHTDLKLYGSYDADYLDEMISFFDRIEGKDVPGATGEDGFNTLDILLEVRSKAGIAPRQ